MAYIGGWGGGRELPTNCVVQSVVSWFQNGWVGRHPRSSDCGGWEETLSSFSKPFVMHVRQDLMQGAFAACIVHSIPYGRGGGGGGAKGIVVNELCLEPVLLKGLVTMEGGNCAAAPADGDCKTHCLHACLVVP